MLVVIFLGLLREIKCRVYRLIFAVDWRDIQLLWYQGHVCGVCVCHKFLNDLTGMT